MLDAIPAGTQYVSGTTMVNGIPVLDNGGLMPFATGAELNTPSYPSGVIISGSIVSVSFQVQVDCCHGLSQISNQGQVSYDGGGAAELTDDLSSGGTADPTLNDVTELAAPTITSAALNLDLECNTVTAVSYTHLTLPTKA